jgi:hypothetical protein
MRAAVMIVHGSELKLVKVETRCGEDDPDTSLESCIHIHIIIIVIGLLFPVALLALTMRQL